MYKTKQESCWASDFGDRYITRNQATAQAIADKTAMFARLLPRTGSIRSVLELGANVGINIHALRRLLPEAEFTAVEINPTAAEALRQIPDLNVVNQSILDYAPLRLFDFVFTSGVLIHINPEMLPTAYAAIYAASARHICIAEYYNPTPVTVPYRDEPETMFKRDFAGEILDTYPDVQLLNYGFAYHRDIPYGADLTWFLMEKRQG